MILENMVTLSGYQTQCLGRKNYSLPPTEDGG